MKLTSDEIKLITGLVIENLGVDSGSEKTATFVREIVKRISSIPYPELESTKTKPVALHVTPKKLIINGFGLGKDGFEAQLTSYLLDKMLKLEKLSISQIAIYQSVIALIDYSSFESDINRLKFELSEICNQHGYKAIIQDSSYYNS
jgi:predicted amino acid-binding ACT domain protein